MTAMNTLQAEKWFDAGRAVLEDYLSTYPARLDIHETQPLSKALSGGQLTLDSRLLTFELEGVLHSIPMTVVLSYNVIQGETDGQPWMMTFCNACNTGMVFDPVVDGQRLHFQRRGSYDGLLLIWDNETESYWQHVTGFCLHGKSVGKQLQMTTTTRQMSAGEALAKQAKAVLLTSTLTTEQEQLSAAMEKMRAKPEKTESFILATIEQEDTRRPRFELGLGVWNGLGSTFYPLVALHTYDNVFITEFDGRQLLIYQEPDAIAPVAAYVDTRRAVWEGDILRLDNGAFIQHDVLFTADGQSTPVERPTQLLMRWYGFALTFPGCRLPTF